MSGIKCNCPGKCEIHPTNVMSLSGKSEVGFPSIDITDRFQLKALENDVLLAEREVQLAYGRLRNAKDQLEASASALFEKYSVSKDSATLELHEVRFQAK